MTDFDVDKDTIEWVPVELSLPQEKENKFFRVMFYLPDTIRGDDEAQEKLMDIWNNAFKEYCEMFDIDYSGYLTEDE